MTRETLRGVVVVLSLCAIACSGSGDQGLGILFPCDDPAPVNGTPSPPSIGYIVLLEDGADPEAEAARLASQCGFVVDFVSTVGEHFSAPLDPAALACVRCDPVVVFVQANAVIFPL